ncbi:avidin-related protein 4/5-like [Spea bombifrons]|uniref:avidin-related protein 4/5-like n=1 Tax=Spea bombifrons TaxID=233779 RepID=UPI002348F2B6|nr:avidin-related protein 4/5-like [Spea bombifrons]
MKMIQVLGLVLLSLGVSTGTVCSVNGRWKNHLGSTMTISQVSNDGSFNGTYLTAVSDAPRKIIQSPLVGWQQFSPQPTFGFTVQWKFTNTTTVFTGQCFVTSTGEKVLRTTWLLRSIANTEADSWEATLKAQESQRRDVFRNLCIVTFQKEHSAVQLYVQREQQVAAKMTRTAVR